MAEVDIEFAKNQLILFLREWYMHPNGQVRHCGSILTELIISDLLIIGHLQLSLLIMGVHWGIDTYRPFYYRADFAEDRLEGVYMCQHNTCEIIF